MACLPFLGTCTWYGNMYSSGVGQLANPRLLTRPPFLPVRERCEIHFTGHASQCLSVFVVYTRVCTAFSLIQVYAWSGYLDTIPVASIKPCFHRTECGFKCGRPQLMWWPSPWALFLLVPCFSHVLQVVDSVQHTLQRRILMACRQSQWRDQSILLLGYIGVGSGRATSLVLHTCWYRRWSLQSE